MGYFFSEHDRITFTNAYIEALVWSSNDDSEEWDEATVSEGLKTQADIECHAFLYRAALWIDTEPTSPGYARAGHDFAFTRNGHGAGFWDGDWPVYGDLLTKISKSFGQIDLCVGDDGKIDA